MVDHLQDEDSRFGGYVGDIVLPDFPPSAEALATRVAQRLYLRRWLLALSSSVILIFVLIYELPAVPAISGFLSILAGAALLPREGVMRPVRLDLRVNDRMLADRAVAGLLEGLPAPAIILNAQGRVLAFNNLARDFFPTIRQNQHLSGAIRDPGVLGGISRVNAALRPRQVVSYEPRVPIERHMEVTISWIGPASEIPGDATPAILVHLRDLTEQERLDRLRTDFIANASHELRTPLASVLGFIETLQGAARNDPAARDHFLEIMARQAYRMKRLIDDLLSLSRVEMRLHLKPQARVDLNDVARQVVTGLEPTAEKAGATVHLAVHGNGAWVLGDRDELVQMASNLVENAIKYGRTGGNVWLSVARAGEAEGGKFALAVRDDGEGIAEKHLPRLTERFYRANDNGGEKSGTGLGLAIVKHVVTRHRGDLKITSRLGEGSIFTVTLTEAPPPI
ncbi:MULTISPECIES: ATP-binding protein [Rhodomicrobium]|uniref:sensor histidine kinase n=1 Tax=Rhodomicrobium TaxID=1068 RepID=UPI000B4C03E6|nr:MULTISPECIES: ATP-binding protein [Rhodomicrobium]